MLDYDNKVSLKIEKLCKNECNYGQQSILEYCCYDISVSY